MIYYRLTGHKLLDLPRSPQSVTIESKTKASKREVEVGHLGCGQSTYYDPGAGVAEHSVGQIRPP